MFDPFKDFVTRGYLRNYNEEKDPEIVRDAEHELFRANRHEAVAYLVGKRMIAYKDFLHVHHILFKGFYPWAGQDRATTTPDSAINKGETQFCHPLDSMRAVNEGLRLGHNARSPGRSDGVVRIRSPIPGWERQNHAIGPRGTVPARRIFRRLDRHKKERLSRGVDGRDSLARQGHTGPLSEAVHRPGAGA